MVHIKKATLKDYKQLKEMKTEFVLEELRQFDKDIDENYPRNFMPKQLKRSLRCKTVVYFIALDGAKAAGFAGGEIEKSESFWRFKKRGHMFNLYVRPGYRRKGIGKRLTNAVLNWFKKKKIKWLKIVVFINNLHAHSLYKKLGFKDFIIELKKVVR